MASQDPSKKQPKDLTSSIHDLEEEALQNDPKFQRTRRLVIRVGNAIFITMAFLLFIPVLVGVGQGISAKKVWNPYTGEPVYVQASADNRCAEDGRRLLVQAGRLDALERKWAEPYREWQTKCKKSEKALYDALERTRTLLRKKQDPTSGP